MGRPAKYVVVAEQGVTEAEFDLSEWRSPYARLLVRDAEGQRAWTNPVWFDGVS
jgi:hypothetical protein